MTTYIFGYGSLINMKYNKELKSPLSRRTYPVIVENMQRQLNVYGAKHLVLGVRDKPHAKTNGILFKVTAEELQKLIRRESLYEPRPLAFARLTFYNFIKNEIQFEENDRILCFYPLLPILKKIYTPKNDKAMQKYIKICLDGCMAIQAAHGEAHADIFVDDFVHWISK